MTEENKSVKKFPNSGNIPKLRFSEFTEEWEERYISEVISSKSKKYNPENSDSNYRSIELESLSQDSGELLSTFNSKNQKSIKNVFNSGDVLFGKLRPYLKKYYLADFDGVCSSEIWVLKSSILDSNYLYAFVQSNSFISLTEISSGSKMPRADWNLVSSSLIVYPTNKDERKKIGKVIQLINSRIQTQRKIIEGLSLQKISIVKKLSENKIKFTTNNKTQIWERKKLSEISEEHLHKNPKNKYNEVFSVAKHKGVINQIEHLGRSFSAKEILHYKLVYPGDLVYTKSPTSDFPFGIIKQNRTGRIGVVSPLYCVFTPKTYALGYLLHEYFNSSVNTFNYLNPLVQKGAKNTMNINNEIFLNGASILLPMEEDEQKKIYEFLSCLDTKINLETELLTQFENQKKYLLQNLFV
ncbi:restriction endonuclease subunit S domain-containing protein [Elizabethkingia anophelis]|uniref:Restriction endonuclease subunit S n=1 Tax=Elizabethkingia anophelis TaxID=1117645 RepID=A0AAU8UQG9_9FLAO|nr:restriction endonuclease subunit S [Elizabethkingia anophelis]AQX00488.1 hypothetical protein BBD32_02900 [Elizabethkingia anophelis]OPB66256.1 hypothetical protein BAY11_14930 [Elizabethkingia anophelis]